MINIYKKLSEKRRLKRAEIFRSFFDLEGDEKILDLGGGDGSHIKMVLPDHPSDHIHIADIRSDALLNAEKKFGYNTVLLDESIELPFEDRQFDIIYCSSVIEHVTVAKDEIYSITDDQEFKDIARLSQRRFADEIRRCSQHFFIQTPYKYFFIEPHTFSPFLIIFLKRRYQIKYINFVNNYWLKSTKPDWILLDKKELKRLFPGAEIREERFLGFTKSIMALK